MNIQLGYLQLRMYIKCGVQKAEALVPPVYQQA